MVSPQILVQRPECCEISNSSIYPGKANKRCCLQAKCLHCAGWYRNGVAALPRRHLMVVVGPVVSKGCTAFWIDCVELSASS